MAAQGEEVLEGFLIGKDVISSAWKQKSAIKKIKINLEIQCRFLGVRIIRHGDRLPRDWILHYCESLT